MPISRHSLERTQYRELTRAFLARFFENEASPAATDVRASFMWLIAFLATPGIFLPIFMGLRWGKIAASEGIAQLRIVTLIDKVIYLDLSFIGIAMVTALVWHTLIVDRRDGLILGALPVSRRTTYVSKFLAVAVYLAIVSIGMHSAAALLYGAGLGSLESLGAIGRNLLAVLISGIGINMFVFSVVLGAQSCALAIAGPRAFDRLSPVLQILLVAVSTTLIVLLPFAARGVLTLPNWPSAADPMLLWLPPVWFLGLYERIVGTDLQVMSILANRAIDSLLIATGVLLLTYPFASRRALDAAVQGTGRARPLRLRGFAAALVRGLTRDPIERAVMQFVLTTVARTHQHRLVLSVVAGLGLASVVPLVAEYLSSGASISTDDGDAALLIAPLLLIFASVVGWRIVAALPSELRAGWVFLMAPSQMLAGRQALRKLMIALCVVPPLLLASPVWVQLWGMVPTLSYLAACTFGGVLLVDAALWGYVGFPCGKPVSPGRVNLQARWPLVVGALYFFAYMFPAWQIGASRQFGNVVMVTPVVVAWWFVRRASTSAAITNGVYGDRYGVLGLDLTDGGRDFRTVPLP